jgi:hypothetical protein
MTDGPRCWSCAVPGPRACCIRRHYTAPWATASPASSCGSCQQLRRCFEAAGGPHLHVRERIVDDRARLHRRLGLVLEPRCWASRRALAPSPLRVHYENFRSCMFLPAARRRRAGDRGVLCRARGAGAFARRMVGAFEAGPLRNPGRGALGDPAGHLALGRPRAGWTPGADPRRPAAPAVAGVQPHAAAALRALHLAAARPGTARLAADRGARHRAAPGRAAVRRAGVGPGARHLAGRTGPGPPAPAPFHSGDSAGRWLCAVRAPSQWHRRA